MSGADFDALLCAGCGRLRLPDRVDEGTVSGLLKVCSDRGVIWPGRCWSGGAECSGGDEAVD